MIEILKSGIVEIGAKKIQCYILSDGRRVLSAKDMQVLLGVSEGIDINTNLLNVLNTEELQPFIKNHRQHFIPIEIRPRETIKVYNSDVLIDVKNILGKAKKELEYGQLPIKVINRIGKIEDLNKESLVDLIDKELNYDYKEEYSLLKALFKTHLDKDLIYWIDHISVEFFKEIYRLNGWGNFRIGNIAENNRYVLLCKWIKDLILKILSKNVINQMKEIAKASADNDHPQLELKAYSIITIMKLSRNWKDFESKFNELYKDYQSDFDLKELEPNIELSDLDQKLKQALNFNPKKD